MGRIPPNLLYLTIYNPSLRPGSTDSDSNEDAEEQAHILFYTSKERAVSRDRMLRQIGLAKALVNFAEIFNSNEPCNNVHSQSRRMLMVTPEPDFWIHAGIEVAKMPRQPVDKKGKSKDKSKLVEKAKEEVEITYDYEDGSVQDIALRAGILQAYERFKLTHGSFTSILSSLGQQALELQLERFFTVWAWSWNLEAGHNFEDQFGVPRHPCFLSLTQIVDDFCLQMSEGINVLVLTDAHVIPSTRWINASYPSSLMRHFLELNPPQTLTTKDPLSSSVDTIKGKYTPNTNKASKSDNQDAGQANFLGMPAINMNVNMDMRKWNWPGYLTFGKSGVKAPNSLEYPVSIEKPQISQGIQEEPSGVEVEVDTSALEDAISSDGHSIRSVSDSGKENVIMANELSPTEETTVNAQGSPSSLISSTLPVNELIERPITPIPIFSNLNVYLSPVDAPLSTIRRKVHYIMRNQLMLALVGFDDQNPGTEVHQLDVAARKAYELFDCLEICIRNMASPPDSLPSATSILQPVDRYIMTTGPCTLSNPGFTSKSGHLFNTRTLQDSDPNILEIFSRGQNPQHWHVAKRLLETRDERQHEHNEVFLEVFRKETNLTDVDNVLAGVVKKYGLVESQ